MVTIVTIHVETHGVERAPPPANCRKHIGKLEPNKV